MKIGFVGKPCIVEYCIFIFCPHCKLKPSSLAMFGRFVQYKNLCTGTVSDHCEVIFKPNVLIFSTHVIPFVLISLDYGACLSEVLPCFLANAQPVPQVVFLPSLCLPLRTYGTNKNSVMCRCPISVKNSSKSSLGGSKTLCFGIKEQLWLSVQSSAGCDLPLHLTDIQ
jgi:hypothetical protein